MTDLAYALHNLEEDKVMQLVDEMLKKGIAPVDIIRECNVGIVKVGELFAAGQYFLTELMFSAEIMQSVMEMLEPMLSSDAAASNISGTFVIGTVSGDIHDIGKNIAINLLRSHGFRVIDLGVDVSAETFVRMVRETGTKLLGLSALLNSTYPEMKKVIDALQAAGLREGVKVIIGGTITSEAVRQFTGADAFATDALTGVNYAKCIYSEQDSDI